MYVQITNWEIPIVSVIIIDKIFRYIENCLTDLIIKKLENIFD